MKNEIIKFRVSKIEQRIIQKKSEKAGLSVSEFLRKLALEKEIKSRLTSEEIECYKTLSKYADNFRRILEKTVKMTTIFRFKMTTIFGAK